MIWDSSASSTYRIGIGVEIDDIGTGFQHQRPVRIGTHVDAGQSAIGVDGIHHLPEAGQDLFFGNADQLRRTESGQGRFVDKDDHRAAGSGKGADLPAGVEGQTLDRRIAQGFIIENRPTVLILDTGAKGNRAGDLPFDRHGRRFDAVQGVQQGCNAPAAGLAQSKTGTGQPVRILTDGPAILAERSSA
jgi:hypothetical protein